MTKPALLEAFAAHTAAGGGAWTPASLTGLVAWWDFSDTATITDAGGGAVSQVTDKSGNGNTLVQATSGNRPLTGTRTLNSLNVLDFDGSNDSLGVTFSDMYEFSIFMVARFDAFGNWSNPTNNLVFKNSGVLNFLASQSSTLSTGVTYRILGRGQDNLWPGNTSFLHINNDAGVGATNVGTVKQGNFTLSDNANSGGNAQNGAVGELIICNVNMGSTDRDALDSYASAKWGTS